MNATISLNSDHSWNRRCSTETILSIQDRETDFARDTSDTEAELPSEGEYEPVTEPDSDAPIDDTTSADTEEEIISTRVVEVSAASEGSPLADSERGEESRSDSEIDFDEYWQCARCRADNPSPLYRYCRSCFQARKSLFPPRPRPKRKRSRARSQSPRALSQDSGYAHSQGTSLHSPPHPLSLPRDSPPGPRPHSPPVSPKRRKLDVAPLSKSVSDPSVSIETIPKKVITDALKEIESKELCVVCVTEPKSGVFVHGRLAHICCCYRCAVKVWVKTKRCPVCKRKISNVLRAVVM